MPQTWWLKTTEICSLEVLEARSLNSRCWRGWAPSFPLSVPWFVAAHLQSLPSSSQVCLPSVSVCLRMVFFSSACVSVRISLFLQASTSYWTRAHPNDVILTIPAETLFPRFQYIFLWGHNSPANSGQRLGRAWSSGPERSTVCHLLTHNLCIHFPWASPGS